MLPELEEMRVLPDEIAPRINEQLLGAIVYGSRIAGAFVDNPDIVPTEDEDGNAVEVYSDAPDDDVELDADAAGFVDFVETDFQTRFGASQIRVQ
jgi:hypothetical protein